MRNAALALCLCVVLVEVAQADSLYFRQVGTWGSGGVVVGVAVKGTYAYVAGASDDEYDGLHVLSLADLAHPQEVWRCSTMAGNTSFGVAVGREYAYYADDTAGVRIFSIANPSNPIEVGRWSERAAYQVKISGDFAYVRDTGGLSIVSVADPTHPTEVGRIVHAGIHRWTYADVVGDYAYAAAGLGGLHIISVADPTHPVEVGQYTPGDVRGVTVRDSYAYVGCLGSFRTLSVADPARPVEVGAFDSAALTIYRMAPIRGYVFAATGNSGLLAISVSDPTHPTLAGYYGGTFGWNAVMTEGDYVFYGALGLRIYQFYQLGDIDIDNDSLDVVADTLRLLRWATAPGEPLESARGRFILANTSAAYNPDSIDGPSASPVDSLRCTGSLLGPGGVIDSIVIPNLPESLARLVGRCP